MQVGGTQVTSRVNERLETIEPLTSGVTPHDGQLDDAVVAAGEEAGRLEIDDGELRSLQRQRPWFARRCIPLHHGLAASLTTVVATTPACQILPRRRDADDLA